MTGGMSVQSTLTAKDLRQIVSNGEDSRHQFKADVTSPDSLAAEVVAFSNAKGGTIYIGVSDDGGIAGLDAQGVRRINQMISNVATQGVKNPVSIVSENIPVGKGRVVVSVSVPEGDDKPYFDKNGIIWLKEGADKRKVASKEEIRRFFEVSESIHADERATKASLELLDQLRLRPFFEKIYSVPFPVEREELLRVVQNMNLATDGGRLNLAGLMMFGLHPESIVPQFCIKAARVDGVDLSFTTFQDREEFAGTLQDMYAGAMAFVTRNMRKVQSAESVNMPGESEIPRIVFEELIVNALVHRSYFIDAPIRIVMFDDRVEIVSPGSLPNHLTVEKVLAGNANIRNPVIASYVAKGLLPYWGLGSGVKRAKAAWSAIAFIDDKPGEQFKAIVSFAPEGTTGNGPIDTINETINETKKRDETINETINETKKRDETINETINETKKRDETINETINETIKRDETINETIKALPGISLVAIVEKTGKSRATVSRALSALKSSGIVEYRGSKKTGGYYLKGSAK